MIRRVPAMLAAGLLAVTGAAAVPSPARAAGGPNAVVAWNTHAHVEAWYAIMGMGAICHTLNPRLTASHLAAMVVQ